MSIIEAAVRLFAPHTCLGCGAEDDRLLCADCIMTIPLSASHCYRCKVATAKHEVCDRCAARTPLRQVLVYAEYQSLARELIHRMKYERARSGVAEAAALMAGLLQSAPEGAIITHVPTATARVRQRGYDHARLLTRSLAQHSGMEHMALLARVGQAHQVGSGRPERIRQLEGAFRSLQRASIQSRHIILVDDVLTTGATLETAAWTLKVAGAGHVSAVVLAQA